MKEPILTLKKIEKSFSGKSGASTLFSDLQCDLLYGKSYAMTGESGVGKSTLLHIASGLEKPTKGSISMMGSDFWSLRKEQKYNLRVNETAIIFQQMNLIPCITARENIEFQARLNQKFDSKLIDNLIGDLGIKDILKEFPENLSGGEQQRVSIARALAARPTILFADEPTGSLDESNSDIVIEMLSNLCKEHKTTLLLITHSLKIASYLDFVLELSHGKLNKK